MGSSMGAGAGKRPYNKAFNLKRTFFKNGLWLPPYPADYPLPHFKTTWIRAQRLHLLWALT